MKLIRRLTDNYKKNPESNIGKLFAIVDLEIGEIKHALKTIESYRLIDNARGTSLDNIGKNLNQPRQALDDVLYRKLLKVKVQANRSGGQIEILNHILEFLLEDYFISVKETWDDPLYANEPAALEIRYFNFFGKIKDEYQGLEDDPWFLDGINRLDGDRLLNGGLTFVYSDFEDRIMEALAQTKAMANFIKTGGVKLWWCEPMEVANVINIGLSTRSTIKSSVDNQIAVIKTTNGLLESSVVNNPQFILDGLFKLNGELKLDGMRPFIKNGLPPIGKNVNKSFVKNNIRFGSTTSDIIKSKTINQPQFILDGLVETDGSFVLDGVREFIIHTTN